MLHSLKFDRDVLIVFEDEEVEVQQKCRALFTPGPKGTPRSITFESDETQLGCPENWQPIRLGLLESNAVIGRIEKEWDEEQRRMVERYDEEHA